MSDTMRIRFADDMPTTAVEVVAPDLQTVGRFALDPGGEQTIEVPSERSFIRLHLPDGRDLTLRHAGDLQYVIDRELLRGRYGRPTRGETGAPRGEAKRQSVAGVRRYHQLRSAAAYSASTAGSRLPVDMYAVPSGQFPKQAPGAAAVLPGGITARWTPEVAGTLSIDGSELAFEPAGSQEPYLLRLDAAGEGALLVSLPGNVTSTYVRSDAVSSGARMVSVRAATASAVADTAGSYLARGNYFAADAMTGWAEKAETALQSKVRDPFAATVAGYLLLRLGRFDLMRDWARNLANWFPMADGSIIWAAQCVADRDNLDLNEARKYFLRAVERGLPVYTEGLHLLTKNLRRMGTDGSGALDALGEKTGRVLWSSPFTAWLEGRSGTGEAPLSFDVGYAANA